MWNASKRRRRGYYGWSTPKAIVGGTSVQKLPIQSARQIVTLRYSDIVEINAGTAQVGGHVFAMNGCFDPDITGVGHQPLGFDQWMALYGRYTVIESKIKCTFFAIADASHVGIRPTDTAAVNVSTTAFLENPKNRIGFTPTAGGGKNFTTITHRARPKDFTGAVDYRDSSTLYGTVGANPAEILFWHVYTGAVNQASDPATMRCEVTIDYTVLLTEPRLPELS